MSHSVFEAPAKSEIGSESKPSCPYILPSAPEILSEALCQWLKPK